MGKRKNRSAGKQGEQCQLAVFISNLPYSFTTPQLEETFSEVGPIRRCFMLTHKGSTEHCRDGIVIFAASEDVDRAIELKNRSSVGGRKIVVEQAKPRPTLQQRRANANHGKLNAPKRAKGFCSDLADAENHSGKQKVARTVIIGGLLNAAMSEDALSCAREIDGVCSIKYPLPIEELEQHRLAQYGCKPEAAAVLYASVRSARAAVTKLHQKEINGGNIWARQLGGEGSKTKKWKLIVHNLPFKATEDEVREKFSSAGFVWDVFIPHDPETGLSKGLAFVKFTSKQDAERAIQMFNEQKFHERTIAVDWAVPKKHYASGANSDAILGEGEHVENNADSGTDSDDMEKADNDSETVYNKVSDTADDFEEEAKFAKQVLQSLMATSSVQNTTTSDGSLKQSSQRKPENKVNKIKRTDKDGDLQGKIFISSLPFDVDAEEVRQRFSSYGEVQSFQSVLHKVTGRPKGSAFLKFSNTDAASAAVLAAEAGPGLGIFLKGRQVTVREALNKESVNEIALKKAKHEDKDRRNLYLAKEGRILEGTLAAEGVSASDMQKRKNLERKKMNKLKSSPNFHVSRTRLIIYNIPKSMNPRVFRKLFIDAVTTRAVKQIPTIHQFLKDSKRGKIASKNHSRGVAFVEFTEHEHALVALRMLNNNPETFCPEHRPIVEFALDNIQTLRQRNMKMQAQRQRNNTFKRGL